MKTHCVLGHLRVPENLTKNGTCRTCAAARSAAYAKAHPDRVYVASVKSRKKHPEVIEKWRAENAGKVKGYCRKAQSVYRRNHPEKAKETSERSKIKRFAEFPEEVRAVVYKAKRRYYKEHPEKVLESNRQRRLLKRNVYGSHSLEEFKALGTICLRCKNAEAPMTRDHVLPLIHGGNDNVSNIQPLCQSCNSWKHDKFIDFR